MKEHNTYNEELGGKNLPDSLRVNPFFIPKNFFEDQEEHILGQIHFERTVGNINESLDTNATANVPNGYFDTLETSIFAKIAEQSLKDKVSEDGFTIPTNYFDDLSQSIEASIAEENLKSIVPALDFQVSGDYFEAAENQIFAKIAESNIHDQVGKESGFSVPTSYFEEASNEIEAKIIVEKWSEELNQEHFTVPTGYFNQLNEKILARTTKQETTILTLPKRTNWRKYSAAAAIALIVGVGSYFGFQNTISNQNGNQLSTTEVNLDHVSDEEILNYLAQVSEGEDLIHLAEYTSDTKNENVQLDLEIGKEEIEEYLNYML